MRLRWVALLALAGLGAALATACAATQRDGATIVNSGSTNASGYAIDVWSDGSASVVLQNRLGVKAGASRAFSLDRRVAAAFFTDLKAARDGHATGVPCMKSASFGTRTTVTWHGWSSPDLSCPPGDALAAALKHDVDTIVAAAHLGPLLYRRGGFNGMPRRVPIEAGSPAPRATPT